MSSESDNFSYLPPPIQPSIYAEEGLQEKAWRKTKENPFVPIGAAVTTLALTYGLWQMRTGDSKMSQKMMRLRIYGQGFTIFAILGGVLYGAATAKSDKQSK